MRVLLEELAEVCAQTTSTLVCNRRSVSFEFSLRLHKHAMLHSARANRVESTKD